MTLNMRIGLYVVLDRGLLGDRDAVETTRLLLGAGVRWFQYRDKRSTDAEFAAALGRLGPLCRASGARLIVNDRVRLAAAACADGVHLGASDMAVAEARRLFGPGGIIGRSVHAAGEVRRAAEEGADYVGAGAVYPTSTKSDAHALGVEGLAAICSAGALPVVAIGGITRARVGAVLAAGAAGVAVASAVLCVDDPAAEARGFAAEIAAFGRPAARTGKR